MCIRISSTLYSHLIVVNDYLIQFLNNKHQTLIAYSEEKSSSNRHSEDGS